METFEFEFEGCAATVVRPDHPNGKWIWKTEFFRAFDQAEEALLGLGYTRVYYCVSNRYGSFPAVRQMHRFHLHLLEKFDLEKKAALFGFSRGGLYAFNYALFYPEYVDRVYLDAPVMDMRSWPYEGSTEKVEMLAEYGLDEATFARFHDHPIQKLPEFFALGIPLLVVAGLVDDVVPYAENAGIAEKYCKEHGIDATFIVKPDCNHHPHSLTDVTPIIDFMQK